MMTGRYLAVLAICALSSCAGTSDTFQRLNPLNLLNSDDAAEAASQTGEPQTPVAKVVDDGKVDVTRVTRARLDFTPSGVIVRADGEVPGLGYHSTRLRPLNFGQPDGNGTIWYEFRVTPPVGATAQGGSQTLSVGTFIPNSRLRSVSSVAITGAQNDVTIRLR